MKSRRNIHASIFDLYIYIYIYIYFFSFIISGENTCGNQRPHAHTDQISEKSWGFTASNICNEHLRHAFVNKERSSRFRGSIPLSENALRTLSRADIFSNLLIALFDNREPKMNIRI